MAVSSGSIRPPGSAHWPLLSPLGARLIISTCASRSASSTHTVTAAARPPTGAAERVNPARLRRMVSDHAAADTSATDRRRFGCHGGHLFQALALGLGCHEH